MPSFPFLSFAVGYRNERSREVKGLTPLDKLPGYRKITYVKREKMKALHDWGLWACLCLLGACRDGSPALGEGLVETPFYNVYADTCTVDISTVLSDSLLTRGDSVCQVGHYKDSSWGEVSAVYYAEYTAPTFTPDEGHSYRLDSLVLRLHHSGHFWGDTLSWQRVEVCRLERPIELNDDEDLYTTTVWPLEPVPLCSFAYRPRPGKREELEIRLPDEWGRQLLDDLVGQAGYLDDQESFRQEFPGLAFVPEAGNSCVTGFLVNDSAMALTLYYEEVSDRSEQGKVVFSVNEEHAYTGIRHDRTGTPLDAMRSGIENLIHSGDLGCRAYLQGLTGFYNQVEFPFINNLQDAGEIVSVEEAHLYLYPLRGSYNKVNQLPDDIRLYITDANNVLEDYVYGSDGVTVQTGNLVVDELSGKATYYSFDVTDFIRTNLGTWGVQRQKLLLNLPAGEEASSFDQVIFTNDPDQERQCYLSVRFKIYNEQ